jgi:hypothetical protein
MFAIIFKCFQVFFLQVFHKHVSSVSLSSFVRCKCYIWIFSKVDRASAVDLHLVGVDQISGGVSRPHGG